jgi:hypothetical protein
MKTSNIETSIRTQIHRALGGLIESAAKDGLVALRKSLSEAGFVGNQYEIFSHVTDSSVIFEIVVNSSDIVVTDKKTMDAIETESSKIKEEMMKNVKKSFEITVDGPRRVVNDSRSSVNENRVKDARKPSRDARSSMMDARNTVAGTQKDTLNPLIENPRGIDVTSDGKLSITIERSTKKTSSGIKFPKNLNQGVMGDFMSRLNDSISDNFSKRFQEILTRHLT